MVFELIEGDTLKEVIDEGALSKSDFFEVADQILDALVAAQKLDILHRDIKPSNVMLTWMPSGRFQVKMLDFGLAKFSEQPSLQTLDQKGSFLGSIDYIAPEQIELRPLDQRTDLYSLGCLLYFSLTQRRPFTGGSMAETMENHLSGKVKPLGELRPDLSAPVCRWVMRLISTEPDGRPADAMTAMEELGGAREEAEAETVEEEIPTAKLVVPVKTTAHPIMKPRVLENTQQIVSSKTTARASSVVPPHPNARRDSASSGNSGGVSQKTIYILLGSAGLLVLLLVIIIAANRGGQDRDRPGPSSPEVVKASSDKAKRAQSSLPPSIEIERTVSSAAGRPLNSGRFFSLPSLPRSNDLLAYYSMGGLLQSKDGSKLRPGINSNLILGAVENVAPNASREHLLVAPNDRKRTPEVGKDWAGVKDVITFVNGQELEADYRLTSEVFTFALLGKVPRDIPMTKILDIKLEGGNRITLHAAGSSFHLGGTLGSGKLILKGAEPGTMANTVIEVNGRQSRVRMWHWRRGKTVPINATMLWGDLPTEIVVDGYRVGCWMNQPKGNKKVELGALAVYRGAFPEGQKRDVSVKLFSGAFPKF